MSPERMAREIRALKKSVQQAHNEIQRLWIIVADLEAGWSPESPK